MDSWVRKIPWIRDRLPTPVFLGFPGSSDNIGSTCNMGDLGLVPGLGISPGGSWQPTPVFLPGESTWTEEPGRLQSMGLQRVGHDRAPKQSTHILFTPLVLTHVKNFGPESLMCLVILSVSASLSSRNIQMHFKC